MADSTVKVSFLGDASSLKRATDDSMGHLSRLGGGIADFAKKAAIGVAAGGIALGAFAKSAIGAASDLAESQGKVNVVFGDQAKEIEAWASKSSTAFGQSKQQALEAVGTYGNLFSAFGVGKKESANMSKSLVELAADLASFNNTSVDDALQALSSGLSGEAEPLKKFGVALSDERLKLEAVRLGLIKTTKEGLTPGAKAQASYALIMKDTALAQGDFARTSDGLANRTRILKARFADIQAEIGTKLLPVAVKLAGVFLDKVLPALTKVGKFAQLAIGNFVHAFKFGEVTTDGFQGRMEQFGIVVRKVFEWLKQNVPPVLAAIAQFIKTQVIPAIQALAQWVEDKLVPALKEMAAAFIKDVWPIIEQKVLPALKKVGEFIRDRLIPALGELVIFIVGDVLPAFFKVVDYIATEIIPTVANVVTEIGKFGKKVYDVAKDVVMTIAGLVLDFWRFVGDVREVVGKVIEVFASIAEGIAAPFKSAFNAIARLWNNTVGKLSFSIPGWVPGIGGNGWDVPDIPEFDRGGVMPGPRGAPGLALLHGDETVLPTHKSGGGTVAMQTINVYLDGKQVASALVNHANSTGGINLRLRNAS